MHTAILGTVKEFDENFMFDRGILSLDKIGFNFGYGKGIEDSVRLAQINPMKAVASLLAKKDGNTLGVACTNVGSSSFLTKCFDPNKITGINISEQPLELCRIIFPEYTVWLVDATMFELSDSSLDNMLYIEGAIHFVRRYKFLQESHRVAKLGERLTMAPIQRSAKDDDAASDQLKDIAVAAHLWGDDATPARNGRLLWEFLCTCCSRYGRSAALSAGILALSAAYTVRSESVKDPPIFTADDFSHPATSDWPAVGGDLNNTRYSALSQINTQNVRQLGSAWVSSKFDDGATSRVTPVVKDGFMFVSAGRRVYALSPKTGERIWSYETFTGNQREGLTSRPDDSMHFQNSAEAVPNSKGVGVGNGMVFVGLQDGHVIALKETTGELVWARQTGLDEPRKGQWAAAAPTYLNGELFTALSNGDYFLRGRLTALDAASGKEIWQVFSIPGPGEAGHETWPSFNDLWQFGGGGVWTNSAVDPELSLVYFTTGNAVPALAGDLRPGDNLYTCSVVAVDIKTGKVRWYYQLVHHDVFEADVGTPVILYDEQLNGKPRKVLAVLRADGYLFELDRETGKPTLPVQERPVPQLESQKTSPTQPYPVGAEGILMDCEDWKKEKLPTGFVLGCMWTPPASPPPSRDPQNVLAPYPGARASPMAYSPQTGYFYAQGLSILVWPRRSQDPYFLNASDSVPGLKEYGHLAAVDSRTGKIAWKIQVPGALLAGGPIVTAGGVLFRSSADGSLQAYDAKNGGLLWRFETGMGGGGSPVAYQIDGVQYVAVSMGPAVWAFKLGGHPSTATAPVISIPQDEFSGPIVDTEEIETTSLERSLGGEQKRYFVDEYVFNPYRARVKVGSKVHFVNNGMMRHQIAALDSSWGTGPLDPTQQAWVTFDRPGEYAYICKEHPWSYGQIIVSADSPFRDETARNGKSVQRGPDEFAEQAMRGKEQFDEYCSSCHGQDLGGRDAAPRLLGDTFMLHWRNRTVGELFENVRTMMPLGHPKSLDTQTYLDIVAYLMHANHSAPGKEPVHDDPESLKLIISGANTQRH